jgi:uncharacterized protein DUF3107
VEVKIGVQNTNRELVLDSSESADDVEKTVSAALTGDQQLLVLSDSKGRRVLVPSDKLAYVEIGASNLGQVGYRS